MEMKSEKVQDNKAMGQAVHIDGRTANEQGFFYRINGRNCKIMSYRGNEENIVIPCTINGKKVTAIAGRAFAGKNIRSVILPEYLRKIGAEAFLGCALKSIELPEVIECIEDNAFGECSELSEVLLKGKKKNFDVSWHAFENTPYILNGYFVVLGNMLLRINSPGYKDETILKIPYNVSVIKKDAGYDKDWHNNWRNVPAIGEIEIHQNVKRIEDKAFAGLTRVKKVYIEPRRSKFDEIYFGRDVFTEIFIKLLVRYETGTTAPYYYGGVLNFKNISFTGINPAALSVYIPCSKAAEACKCIQLEHDSGDGDMCFTLDIKEYYKLMLTVKSLKEQLCMANCLFHGLYRRNSQMRKDVYSFILSHINRAVEFMLKNNDLQELEFYISQDLLNKKDGLNLRHMKYLTEKYNNEAAAHLKMYIEKGC